MTALLAVEALEFAPELPKAHRPMATNSATVTADANLLGGHHVRTRIQSSLRHVRYKEFTVVRFLQYVNNTPC
jgi:hypothetical protein